MNARKRWGWLLLAVLLFIVAALLMRGEESDGAKLRAEAAEVRMPRRPDKSDLQRARQRATLSEPQRAEPGQAPLERRRDPLLRVLPPVSRKEDLLVIEANAIRYSPIGERLLGCISGKLAEDLAGLRARSGFDPLEDIDRVGVVQGGAFVSGDFHDKIAGLEPEAVARPYGEHGQLYLRDGKLSFALWREEMLILVDSEQEAQAAIDRLEHPDPDSSPPLHDSDAYGEVYGRLSPDTLLELMPPESRERLAEKLQRAAEQIDLHATIDDSVGLVATVRGQASPELTDLGKSLGAALAVGRVFAQSEGEKDLAEILELARVRRSEDSLDAELALPARVLDKHLERACRSMSRTSTEAGR